VRRAFGPQEEKPRVSEEAVRTVPQKLVRPGAPRRPGHPARQAITGMSSTSVMRDPEDKVSLSAKRGKGAWGFTPEKGGGVATDMKLVEDRVLGRVVEADRLPSRTPPRPRFPASRKSCCRPDLSPLFVPQPAGDRRGPGSRRSFSLSKR